MFKNHKKIPLKIKYKGLIKKIGLIPHGNSNKSKKCVENDMSIFNIQLLHICVGKTKLRYK